MDGSLQAGRGGHMIWRWQSRSQEFYMGGVLDLCDMGQGELCHDRCACLLLADCMRDVGASQAGRGKSGVQAANLSPGFGDLREM